MGASRKIGGLTLQERKFVKEYIKTEGNGKLATQRAYPNMNANSLKSFPSTKLNKPEIKNAILKALDKAGLNEDYIANTLKKNIPDQAIGKGATATTVNKTLELLIKLREPVRENKRLNMNYTMFQDISNLSNKELIDKRTKTASYFNKILSD